MSSSRVAIVIPCYNVGVYLDECVESVVRQGHVDLQIVLVDDGSTDSTPERVDAWAARDERIVVVRHVNAGLGAARNTGVMTADADYVLFLDGDDLLPPDAIERLVRSADESGSDFVSGVAARFNANKVWRSGMYKPCFDTDQRATHIFNEPDLLYDHIACSKLFRLDFWRGQAFEFPTGVLFEDIELITRAHCRASAVDLVAEPTYLWRERQGESVSITQARTAPGSAAARFAALSAVDTFLRESAPKEIWEAHATKAFSLDVPAYCRLINRALPTYPAEFVEAAGSLADHVAPAGIERVGAIERMLWNRLRHRDEAGVRACARILDEPRGSVERIITAFGHLGPGASATILRDESPRVRHRLRQRLVHGVVPDARGAVVWGLRSVARRYALSTNDTDAAVRRGMLGERVVGRLSRTRLLRGPRRPGPTPSPTVLRTGTVGAVEVDVSTPHEGAATVSFRHDVMTATRVVLLHERERLEVEVPRDGDGFTLALNLVTRFGLPATFRAGTWNLLAIDDRGRTWTLTSAAPVRVFFPDSEAGATYLLKDERGGINLWVDPAVRKEERAGLVQEAMVTTARHRARRRRPLRTVLYECYFGRSVGCHPRAVFEGLRDLLPGDVDHVFVTQPGALRPPPGARTVPHMSRDHHDLLAGAAIVVSNGDLFKGFERGDEQVVLQTWHGTPLKRIGLDIESPRLRNPNYQRDLARSCAQWSLLVSPTDDTDEIFRRAFAYEGELVQAGSPRNDRLVDTPPGERRAVRARLGLTDDQQAILFAPTFRDDDQTDVGHRARPQCDIGRLARSVPTLAVVLFRAHANIRASEIPWPDDRVLNVSDYPDAQDLILAGDVLVTDYSSLMFDWALTGKPIVLYAPDLAHYRSTRDFYYDYEPTMPVDVTTTQTALEEALNAAVDGGAVDYAGFVKRFAGRDDGRATRRVVDRVLDLVSF